MAIIYMGSLDDRVYRYPWAFSRQVNQSYLKSYLNSIVRNTLIGHQSAINDGYLVTNPALRNSLFVSENSILRDLLYTGEIVIPGRTSSFDELIKLQIENEIPTFKKIPLKVLQEVDKIDKELKFHKARIDSPDSMKVWSGFYEMMNSLTKRQFEDLGLPKTYIQQSDFELAMKSYLNKNTPKKPASRTQWENTLKELGKKDASNGGFTAGKHTQAGLMNLGNEAYHYNFAHQLTKHSDKRIDVETANTNAFSHLLDKKQMDIGTMVEKLPLLEIPKLNNLLERQSIETLLDGNSLVSEARTIFIEALGKFDAQANDDTLKELIKRAENYNIHLDKEFGKPKSVQFVASAANFSLSMATVGASLLMGLAAPVPTILWGALFWGAGEAGTRIITNQFVTENPKEIDYTQYLLASSKMKSM